MQRPRGGAALQHDTLKEELTGFTKKVRIEIVAPDEMLPDILRIIHHNAHAGQTGDAVLGSSMMLSLLATRAKNQTENWRRACRRPQNKFRH